MPHFVVTSWHGQLHHAKDYTDTPTRLRSRLGTELHREPIDDSLAKWPLFSTFLILQQRGKIK